MLKKYKLQYQMLLTVLCTLFDHALVGFKHMKGTVFSGQISYLVVLSSHYSTFKHVFFSLNF